MKCSGQAITAGLTIRRTGDQILVMTSLCFSTGLSGVSKHKHLVYPTLPLHYEQYTRHKKMEMERRCVKKER